MAHQADCIFCKIARGEISCTELFADEAVLSFLDVGPLAEGHALLIPREHYERIDEMPEALVAAVTRHLPRLCRAVVQAVDAVGCNVLQNNGRVAGQVVEHVHFHIIPRRENDGLGYRWPAGSYAEGRAEEVARRIRGALA